MSIGEKELLVCHKLKTLREEARMSQLDLALAAGVSQNMIAYIENGKRTPTLSTLLKLCTALNVSPEVLFKESKGDEEEVRALMHKYIDYYVR